GLFVSEAVSGLLSGTASSTGLDQRMSSSGLPRAYRSRACIEIPSREYKTSNASPCWRPAFFSSAIASIKPTSLARTCPLLEAINRPSSGGVPYGERLCSDSRGARASHSDLDSMLGLRRFVLSV